MFTRNFLKSAAVSALLAGGAALPAHAVFFHIGSGSIDGSLCVGNDCVASEAFGFDTVRLKENNLRIHFDDTSTASSFPRNDWRILINGAGNGTASYLAVEDATAARQVFRVEAGARTNALTVDAQGDVGIGLLNATVDLHVRTGNTPTLRLDQDGTSGFTPQSWDVAGNEAGFFIRDVTNGSQLPFRIIPGADSSALVIDDDNDIGMGAGTNPSAPLHVRRTDSTAVLLKLENANASSTGAAFTMEPSGGSNFWQVTATANTNIFRINRSGNANTEFELNQNGDLTTSGTVNGVSDKNRKMAIEEVDAGEILEKSGAAMPIAEWSYKHDAETGIRHIGPMAQDFHALFGTGPNDKVIPLMDASGVALAAIKALSQESDELRARLESLETRIAD